MAVLQASDIPDLVSAVLHDLGPNKFQNIASTLQHCEVFSKWFKKDKVAFDSGIGIQKTLLNKLSGAARHVGLMDNDQTNIVDVLDIMQVPWRHAETSWALIYETDILMNSGKAQIVSTLKAKRASALLDLAEHLEDKAWGTAPTSTDKKNPWGVKYWVTTNATAGHTGGAAAGNTTVAGVSLTDSPNFKNYSTGAYVNVTKADLVKKLRTAIRKCQFVSPINIKDYRSGKADRYRLYCNEETLSAFEDVGESQNESLGKDIASMDGQTMFRRFPIIYIPALDSDTTDPVYGLDHSTFYPACLKGAYLRESEAKQSPTNRRVFNTYVDLSYNFVNVDRRRNFVAYK